MELCVKLSRTNHHAAAPTINTIRKSSVGPDAQHVECPGLPVVVHWCSSVTEVRSCFRSKLPEEEGERLTL